MERVEGSSSTADVPAAERGLNRLAWTLWVISVSIPVVGLLIQLLRSSSSSASNVVGALVFIAVQIGLVTIGRLVISRQARNPIGWIFLAVGFLLGLNTVADAYATHRVAHLPGGPEAACLANLIQGPTSFAPFVFVFLLFPDGRLLSPRWRNVARVVAGVTALLALGDILRPGPLRSYPAIENPFGVRALGKVLSVSDRAAFILLMLGLIASAGSLVLRFRRSHGDERQQLKWVAAATVLGALLVITGPIFWFVLPASLAALWNAILLLAAAVIPLSIGIAILRYRLYDIDLIINRALVYGSLTVAVVGLYVLVVGYVGAVLRTGNNYGISLLATGIVAVVFQPLRERLQRWVNHLMYGERDDPYRVISRLGERLESAVSPQTLLPTVVETVAQALKLPYVAIALHEDGETAVAAASGTPPSQTISLPLVYQGDLMGHLLLAPRAPGESFNPADHRLLADLARQASIAAHAVRLTADLQRSRERLVTAREEERRRLRRDLHDGLGPSLAAQTLKLGSARALYPRDAAGADALLAELEADMEATVTNVRRLVYDLRPPALDELGLVGAVREIAAEYSRPVGDRGAGLSATVEAPDDLSSLPAAVEVAAYRIVQEALTNVVRHAGAASCRLSLGIRRSGDREWLQVTVEDDGIGLMSERKPGVGLTSMRERAAELGGTLVVETLPEGGTRVAAGLPMARSRSADGPPSRPPAHDAGAEPSIPAASPQQAGAGR